MGLSPHLSFNGQCEAAFRFYETCVPGSRIVTLVRWGDTPMAGEAPADWSQKVLHATLQAPGGQIAGTDVRMEEFEAPQGFSLLLDIENPAEAERVFSALAEGGTVRMPLQTTFWAERFGVVVDRFGVSWEINCGRAE